MNCTCHCNGKCQLLCGLEQKIMDILWQSPAPLKPAEVLKKIGDNHAYTTIMTVLKRMADKKLVKRVILGNAYTYAPVSSKKDFAASALKDLFERIFCAYGDLAVSSFKQAAASSGIKL